MRHIDSGCTQCRPLSGTKRNLVPFLTRDQRAEAAYRPVCMGLFCTPQSDYHNKFFYFFCDKCKTYSMNSAGIYVPPRLNRLIGAMFYLECTNKNCRKWHFIWQLSVLASLNVPLPSFPRIRCLIAEVYKYWTERSTKKYSGAL